MKLFNVITNTIITITCKDVLTSNLNPNAENKTNI